MSISNQIGVTNNKDMSKSRFRSYGSVFHISRKASSILFSSFLLTGIKFYPKKGGNI